MRILQHVDPTGSTMVARVPSSGTAAIELGSQLIVEESQQAVFFRDGKALDTFGPGRHTLATMNLPLLGKILGLPFEGKSPFQAAVVFVSTKTFLDLKWGTKEPVAYRDKELSMVRLRAFGKFAVRIANAQQFVNEVVGSFGKQSVMCIAINRFAPDLKHHRHCQGRYLLQCLVNNVALNARQHHCQPLCINQTGSRVIPCCL